MSRTKIPNYLMHKPKEVKRNAERYDRLCKLTEKITNPTIKKTMRDVIHILFNDLLILEQKNAERDYKIAELKQEVSRLSDRLPESDGK